MDIETRHITKASLAEAGITFSRQWRWTEARKSFHCDGCGGTIQPGELYRNLNERYSKKKHEGRRTFFLYGKTLVKTKRHIACNPPWGYERVLQLMMVPLGHECPPWRLRSVLDPGPSPVSTQAAGGEDPSSSPPGAET